MNESMNVITILSVCFFNWILLLFICYYHKKFCKEHFVPLPLNCKKTNTNSTIISIDSLPLNVSSNQMGITNNDLFLKLISKQFVVPKNKTNNFENIIPRLFKYYPDKLDELETSVRFRFTLFLSKMNNELKYFICNHVKLSSVKSVSVKHLIGTGEAIVFKKSYSSYAKHIDFSFEIIKQSRLSEGFRLIDVKVKGLIAEDKLTQFIDGVKSFDKLNKPLTKV